MKKVLLFIVLCCFLQTIMAQNTRNTHFSISSNNEIFYLFFTKDMPAIHINHYFYELPDEIMMTKCFYNIFNWRKDLLFSLYFNHWRIFTGMGYEERNIGIDNIGDISNGKATSVRFHQETLTIPLGFGYYRELGTSFLYGGNIGIEIDAPRRLESVQYYSQKLTATGISAYEEMADVPDEYFFYSIKGLYNLLTFLNFEIGYKMNSFCNVNLGLNCKYLTYSYEELHEFKRESHSSYTPKKKFGPGPDYPIGSNERNPRFTLGLNLKVEVKI